MDTRKRPEHMPLGDPCQACGEKAANHRARTRYRPEHKSDGNPCSKCGLPAEKHEYRSANAKQTRKELNKLYPEKVNYIGIDGEGQGRDNHRYVLLAASNVEGTRTWYKEAEPGKSLSTVECLDLILSLPSFHTKIFAYSFNYDLTKILNDLGNAELYLLFRPELRSRTKNQERGPWPIKWNGYSLNLQGTKFSVKKDGKRIVIWDLFKFFGSKFTNALKDWGIGSKDFLDKMNHMKDKRSDFDKESREDVLEYCLSECRSIAQLSEKLITAHNDAGLTLRSYYGAGSSGAAMLSTMDIESQIVPVIPEMKEAVASAFFGGRFENSVIGKIEGRVHGWDISSAYPYQLYFLPCLQHGQWKLTKNRDDIDRATTALVRYRLPINDIINSWGPFPYRTPDGSICFPKQSGGGWVWKDEYISGERFAKGSVQFVEAWVYNTTCGCRPFKKIAEYYVQRCMIGKEGKGIVLKLGCNSCYGKLAQSVGNGRFNNWIWAGLITAGCRAQILDLLSLHKDPANALMIATDGLYTTEEIETPPPINTGTNLLIGGKRKPLGGWEHKCHDKGVFVARPGIYFPLNPTIEDLKEVRARGVGKGIVLENWKMIVESYEKYGADKTVSIANVSRFCGAKTSISKSKTGYNRSDGTANQPRYGQWIQRKIEMSFNPLPKREGVAKDNRSLIIRSMPLNVESLPYQKALRSKESIELQRAQIEQMEQPDKDFSDYEPE